MRFHSLSINTCGENYGFIPAIRTMFFNSTARSNEYLVIGEFNPSHRPLGTPKIEMCISLQTVGCSSVVHVGRLSIHYNKNGFCPSKLISYEHLILEQINRDNIFLCMGVSELLRGRPHSDEHRNANVNTQIRGIF
jgi:hypothetical protein